MNRATEAAWVTVVGAATLVAYYTLFGAFFPVAGGTIGHDYSYFLPQLLNGKFWFTNNGLFSVPWFTPAFGAGMPYYPNPVNTYYSVPQLLALFVDPLVAVRVTLVLGAGVGFVGTYLLLRRVFEISVACALFGACAFAFNGFFSHRMLVGHIAFHSFMLIPLIGYWSLRKPHEGASRFWQAVRDVVLLAFAYAYLLQSANVHGIPVVFLALAAFALLLGMQRGWTWCWLWRTLAAGPLALALCATKLAAAGAFMGSFPRTGYPLPGFRDTLSALEVVVRSLFAEAPIELAMASIENMTWHLTQHEFEYGLTLVPAVILIAGALRGAWFLMRSNAHRDVARRRGWMAGVLLLLLAVPIALNVYEPGWNAFIKSIPLFGSSSSMVRFLSTFVPIVVVTAALTLDKLGLPPWTKRIAATAAISVSVLLHWQVARPYYVDQPYRPDAIVEAWHAVEVTREVPPVTTIIAPFDANGQPALSIDRNDALVRGESQLICYEPIFGYQLEWFPIGPARYGMPALEPLDQRLLNVKNPACFVFPDENGGEPGSHFRRDQRAEAEAFLAYRPFEFEPSGTQALAHAINLAALVLVPGLLLLALVLGRRRAA